MCEEVASSIGCCVKLMQQPGKSISVSEISATYVSRFSIHFDCMF